MQCWAALKFSAGVLMRLWSEREGSLMCISSLVQRKSNAISFGTLVDFQVVLISIQKKKDFPLRSIIFTALLSFFL